MGENEKYKCPIDGKKYDQPGKCPDHQDVDLVSADKDEEEGAEAMGDDKDGEDME